MDDRTLPPVFYVLFHAGGTFGVVILLLGLLLVAWGVFNLTFARNRLSFLVHGLLCLAPLVLGLVGMFQGYSQLAAMCQSTSPPQPKEIAQTMAFTMASGILGGITTLIPSVLAFVAFAIKGQNEAASRSDRA